MKKIDIMNNTYYRIYTSTNLADTSRDPDDIKIKELGYKNKLEKAETIANEYIKNHFFCKDTKLNKNDR